MKVAHLLEAKVEVPEWAKSEDAAFKALVKKFGFACTKRPVLMAGVWVFGGELKDTSTSELALSLEKRVAGLQKAVARHLFDLKEQGREVTTYDARWIGSQWYGRTAHDTRPFLPDDRLSYFETRVRDKLFINSFSTGGYIISFQYGVSEPKVEEPKPVEKPRVLRVVKGVK